jgi:hypothetical protein
MDVDCVDFRLLNSNSLWDLFERRSVNGGAVAYAVLSKAKKIGCLCGSSLEKTKDSRLKQLEYWKQFCEKTCNLMWAKRFAFSIVSSRVSFRGRLTAIWSSEPVKLTQQRVISNPVGCVDNDIARIASLAVYSRSAELLDQVIYCAKDCRASIIDDLWALLLSDFLCNSSWAPCHKYSFNDEILKITPESACSVGISIASVRELWTNVLSYLSGIFSGKHYKPNLDVDTIWSAHVSTSAIPTCHHAITMWVLLLWTSNSISPFLEHAVKLPQSGPCFAADAKLPQSGPLLTSLSVEECGVSFTTNSDKRVDALLMLRSKGMITKAEFEQMRRRIIHDLGLQL